MIFHRIEHNICFLYRERLLVYILKLLQTKRIVGHEKKHQDNDSIDKAHTLTSNDQKQTANPKYAPT